VEYLPLRDVVDELMQTWLAAHHRESYELLVLHTHSHGDHVAGDGQFTDRVNTVLVQADRDIGGSSSASPRIPTRSGRSTLAVGYWKCSPHRGTTRQR
jgi:glyoxylase-like metal-dependent hydrolase (beta-lactamase superfamily II)